MLKCQSESGSSAKCTKVSLSVWFFCDSVTCCEVHVVDNPSKVFIAFRYISFLFISFFWYVTLLNYAAILNYATLFNYVALFILSHSWYVARLIYDFISEAVALLKHYYVALSIHCTSLFRSVALVSLSQLVGPCIYICIYSCIFMNAFVVV